MRKEHILNSPRFEEYKKKKSKNLRKKVYLILFLFLVVFISLVFISRIKKINIDQIIVTGNKVVDTKDIENITQQKLDQKYIWLFPKSNAFIYPEKSIKNNLLTNYKRLTDVDLKVKDNKILEIFVKEREGKYIWCGDIKPVENTLDQKCYFSDSEGYIFDTAPYFSDGVYLKLYGKINNENKIGTYFVPESFKNIIHFKDLVEKMDLKIRSVSIQENKDMNMYLSSGAEIRFNSLSDVEKLSQSLQAAIITPPFSTDFKNNPSSLLYIDLRFGNKVYFKFK